jgi:hypothetical protein
MLSRKFLFIGLILVSFIAPNAARASYNFEFAPVDTYSGKAITGSLTAVFTNIGPGKVELTITSFLGANESVDGSNGLYFNFNPKKDDILKGLHFSLISSSPKSNKAAGIKLSADGFKASNGGLFDIELTYSSSKVFSEGQSQSYIITDSKGAITAGDFLYLSTQLGSGHEWLAAMDVNMPGKTTTTSWVGATDPPDTPLPGTVWLFGSGLAAMVGLKRKYPA